MKTLNSIDLLKDPEYIEFTGVQESQNILSATELADVAVESFSQEDANTGLKLPFPKTHDDFALRPGEVTLWTGINGHGKSQILNQICALTMPISKWLIASLEMPLRSTVNRMVKQMGGLANPSEDYIRKLIKKTDGQVWLYDQIDTVESSRILGLVDYAANKLGVEHIIIDSLVKCGLGLDDYNAQKNFVDRLAWSARRNNVHIHLVHHIRKSEREGKMPDKFDVKGAGEIVDLVDNLVIFHRNKDKEDQCRILTAKHDKTDNDMKQLKKLEGIPDNVIYIAKQRHGTGKEGKYGVYHEPNSLQYLSSPKARPFSL